ncbi:hypothetical protein TSUD_339400 [Trifolium subterraneum]|nr:hypothetical protein TSUD_339400 [Trifolium subterraneum]
MWYRVLVARYSEVAGRLAVGGRSGSVWWREVSKIYDGESVGGMVCGEYCEEVKFGCRDVCVRLGGRGSDVEMAQSIVWQHDIVGGYSVRGAYQVLTTMETLNVDADSDLIWHKQVPLKVSVLAWMLWRNGLPTKDNLAARNIIPQDSQLCVIGCGGYWWLGAPLWRLIRAWVSMSSADPISVQDHFVQFIHSTGSLRAHRYFLQLVWLCCISVIWIERNNRVSRLQRLKLTNC